MLLLVLAITVELTTSITNVTWNFFVQNKSLSYTLGYYSNKLVSLNIALFIISQKLYTDMIRLNSIHAHIIFPFIISRIKKTDKQGFIVVIWYIHDVNLTLPYFIAFFTGNSLKKKWKLVRWTYHWSKLREKMRLSEGQGSWTP